MRYVWITFLSLTVLLLALIGWPRRSPEPSQSSARRAETSTTPARTVVLLAPRPASQVDSVVTFAVSQLGSPYTYAGTTPASGFDCSGFVMYVFGHFGVEVPHSTALLIEAGHPVPRDQARKGDIVVFTGTATASTVPGHAGIVISEAGEPIRFVHASSARRESGVKISTVAGTDYERRFMGVRRVLPDNGRALAPTAAPRLAKLTTAAPAPPLVAPTPLPKTVKKVSLRSTNKTHHKKTAAKKPLPKHAGTSRRPRTRAKSKK